jgi:DNA-binding transcriptional MocR family regulator
MPQGFHWEIPDGGMFIWVSGPSEFDSAKLLANALQEGVAYVAGNAFFAEGEKGQNSMRLNFTLPQEVQIQEGIRRLARALAGT